MTEKLQMQSFKIWHPAACWGFEVSFKNWFSEIKIVIMFFDMFSSTKISVKQLIKTFRPYWY